MMFTADWLMLAAHAAYALGVSRVYSADRAVEEMGTFLQDFPSVSRKHALAALELLRHSE